MMLLGVKNQMAAAHNYKPDELVLLSVIFML